MPIELEFHSNGVVIRETGIITNDEFLEAVDAIYDYEYSDGLSFQLADLSRVTDLRVSVDVMRDVGRRDLKESRRCSKQFLIVVAPPLSYTRIANQVWEVWAKDHEHAAAVETNIVDTFQEAIEWLRTFGIRVE